TIHDPRFWRRPTQGRICRTALERPRVSQPSVGREQQRQLQDNGSKRGSSLSPRPNQRREARSDPPPPSHACTSPPLPYMLRLNTSETSVSPPCRNLKGLAREVSSRFAFGEKMSRS